MKRIIVASNNKGKIAEIKELLKDSFEVLSLNDAGINIDPEETGKTFFDNALIKAKAVYEVSGEWTLSDDSGLCVDALNGAPGVYSARYAGKGATDDANNALLLKQLEGIDNRNAYFACSVVLYIGKDNYLDAFGKTDGEILHRLEGRNGFGYDPLFYSHELNESFGIATPQDKNKISHRKRALVNLINKLKKI